MRKSIPAGSKGSSSLAELKHGQGAEYASQQIADTSLAPLKACNPPSFLLPSPLPWRGNEAYCGGGETGWGDVCLGGTTDKQGVPAPHGQATDVEGMEPIHVLLQADGIKHLQWIQSSLSINKLFITFFLKTDSISPDDHLAN